MLGETDLTSGQQAGVTRLVEWYRTLMVAEMGFGKSVVTLTAIRELMRERVIERVLIVAPLRVVSSVWGEEVKKWSHLSGLSVELMVGGVKARERVLDGSADIVVTNFEQLPWLFRESKSRGRGLFDGLVVDEISRLRVSGGVQFKALRGALKEFTWRVGLTGTPVSEDWRGLFGQMLVVDDGKALGTRADRYLRRYFYPEDWNEYKWLLHDWAAARIAAKVRGVVFVAERYSDSLPDITYAREEVVMSEGAREAYEALRGGGVWNGEPGVEVVAESAAVLSGKLEQLAGGFLYLGEEAREEVYRFDRVKARRCVELVREARAAGGGGVIVCYWYKADLAALRWVMPWAEVLSEYKGEALGELVRRWNRRDGSVPVLLVHPRSAGHGLCLDGGGSRLIWYTLPWSRDLFVQTNCRIHRRGQNHACKVTWLETVDSIDKVKMARVDGKAEWEALFEEHLGG